jgi:hypothetical protein
MGLSEDLTQGIGNTLEPIKAVPIQQVFQTHNRATEQATQVIECQQKRKDYTEYL